MFDSLRLPVEDAAEAATEILAEVLVELAGETELARTELVAVHCWDSLESYTSL